MTIQAQILDLLRELLEQLGKSLIFITHDLGVAAVLCDHIAVMYAGNIVELADRKSIFENPLHPYTQGLLRALPRRGERDRLLDPIPGVVCNLLDPPQGCNFRPPVRPEHGRVRPGRSTARLGQEPAGGLSPPHGLRTSCGKRSSESTTWRSISP